MTLYKNSTKVSEAMLMLILVMLDLPRIVVKIPSLLNLLVKPCSMQQAEIILII
jgi:hypothetical protein